MSKCDDGTALPIYGQWARRMCLKCGEEFKSSGKGNRICLSCQRHNKVLMSGPNIEVSFREFLRCGKQPGE